MSNIADIALGYQGFPAINYQHQHLGNKPEGFDCSGFVQWVLKDSGIAIPRVPETDRILRHSEEFFDFLGYLIHQPARKPGDLVFFSGNGYRPTHIGIYVGDDKMIHSPGKNGRKVTVRNITDYCNGLLKPRKHEQIYFENPIGYKRVAIPAEERFQIDQ